MLDFFVENAWIIPLLPLWMGLIIIFGINTGLFDNKKLTTILTLVASFVGLIFSIFITAKCAEVANFNYNADLPWVITENLKISVGFYIDNLAALMLLIVTSISFLVQLYSYGYMKEDDGFHRFFIYLNFFSAAMLALVLSSNLFEMYIFWELVGLVSYLLIGFWFTKPSASKAALKAFVVNRIGDCGFLFGLIAFATYSFNYWQYSNSSMLAITDLSQAGIMALNNCGPLIFALIAFGIFMGAMAKSAQIPFHVWLPDAMEGPTPISALIHAATMVAAGVYLIARTYPIFELSPAIMTVIAWVGAMTALISAIIALTQFDIKKVLAYSTCSQLGFMVMAMGAGAYSAGLYHLTTHAYFKALLFLLSGVIIHSISNQQDMRYMGGLRKKMPFVAVLYLIATLSISGILLSGCWSKEAIYEGLLVSNNDALFAIAAFTAFLTVVYMFRTYFMTFEGEYRGHENFHPVDKTMLIPLVILAVPSIYLGHFLTSNGIIQDFIATAPQELIVNSNLVLISLGIALFGFFTAAVFYWDKFPVKIKPSEMIEKHPILYKLSYNKFYFDDIYSTFIDKVFLRLCRFSGWFDKYIIDGFVNLLAIIAEVQSKIIKYFQNGNVQSYISVGFVGLVGLMFSFVAIYSWYILQGVK